MSKTVTIVGAGIGGLCTGLRLLHQGYDVTIYEKTDCAGGVLRYTSSSDEAFQFDESASIPINAGTYFEIFKDLGKDPKDYLEWIPLEQYYKVFYNSGKRLNLYKDLSQTQEEIGILWPKEVEGYTKYVFDTSLSYLTAKKYLLNRTYMGLKDIFSFKIFYELLKISPFVSASTYIAKYIKTSELRELILFQTLYMGISPYEIPSIYTAIAAQTQIDGLIHFKGGLAAYAKALVKLFNELGGKIYYNHPIEQVLVTGTEAKGILCGKRVIPSDVVVLNSDFAYSQRRLLPLRKTPSFKYSCSTFIIHLGISKKYKELNTHNLYINKHFKEEINRIFKGKLPVNPSLYIYAPSCVDNSFCTNPEHSVMNIMIRVPNLHFKKIKWDEDRKESLYKLCMRVVSSIPELADIEENIIYHKLTTPIDFLEKYHYTYGSCFGIGHTFSQSLTFRPQVKDKEINNLYYVGVSIHPGNGVSIVMDGAKLLVETIKEEQ